jgi:3-methylcrotonyl-CoA carboxylase alpha subunit
MIEKLIERPRHVEVQVLADKHGGIVHLFERDCSVQRNNQKLLEEAPAPHLSQACRAALHDCALRLARAIDYDSVGTMEFLLDAASEQFFFLEMNTRLQVEHTVTEAVTGLDLVEWQLRVAAGEPLAFGQDDIRASGCAIEARIAAERADENFRPDVGRIALWRPPDGPGIRVDSGVETGSRIGLDYDSLLAKVIAHGADRSQAATRLAMALDRLTVLGPATIRPFLADAVRSPIFLSGRATTRFISDAFPQGWSPAVGQSPVVQRLAAAVWWFIQQARRREAGASPWSSLAAFRLSAPSGRPGRCALSVRAERLVTQVAIEGGLDRLTVSDDSGQSIIEGRFEDDTLSVGIDGIRHIVPFAALGRTIYLRLGQVEARFEVAIAVEAALAGGVALPETGSVTAPMPGILVEITVAEGAMVEAGAIVAVIESMKLFTDIKCSAAGRIARIAVAKGQTLAAGDLVLMIDSESTDREPKLT